MKRAIDLLTVTVHGPCERCNGTGLVLERGAHGPGPGGSDECDECEGSGRQDEPMTLRELAGLLEPAGRASS